MAQRSLTKNQQITAVAQRTGLPKKDVSQVIESMTDLIVSEVSRGRPVNVMGLTKVSVAHKAATPARQGRNPATGQPILIGPKPARTVVKSRPLKGLKEAV